MSPTWPLRSYRTLAALPNAAFWARRLTGEKVVKWGMGALKDTAELVVSELVTNAVAAMGGLDGEAQVQHELAPWAVRHQELTTASYVRLRLSSDGRRLLVAVWDGSPEPPVVKAEGTEAEHGRGLLLVEALAERWGWYWVAGAPRPAVTLGGRHAWRDGGTCRAGDERRDGVGGKVVWCEVG